MHYWKLAAAAALFAAPGSALAQRDREQSPQLFIPASGTGGEATYKVGDYVLRVPLVWARAAILTEGVTVTAGDRTETLAAGMALPDEILLEAEESKTFFTAFCTPRKAAERGLDGGLGGALFGGSLTRSLVRSATDAQFCLVDSDSDGKFDKSMLVGAGWGEVRTPRAITPVGFERRANVPISAEDEVRIQLRAVGKSQVGFRLEIVQQGNKRAFQYIGGSNGVIATRDNWIGTKKGLPQFGEIYGAEFEITAFDRAARTVTIRWLPVPRDRAMAIPDGFVIHWY